MDPSRFDALTRGFAASWSRRRVIAAVGAGLAIASRSAPATASCSTGADFEPCGTQCYDPRQAFCADPAFNGGQGAICLIGTEFCAPNCCPAGKCCGNRCCDADNTCGDSATSQCCPNGWAFCPGQACVNPATACATGSSFDPATCSCKQCQAGQETCNGTCVLPCPPDTFRDFNTCACRCVTPCGDSCCPVGRVCSSDGGETGAGVCCAAGDECGAGCKSDPAVLCCDGKGGRSACVSGVHTCCPAGKKGGPSCCLKGSQVCDQGRCVKKHKKKHKKH